MAGNVPRVCCATVGFVVGQLLPAESLLSNLVPGQHPFVLLSQSITVVVVLLADVAMTVVETGQLTPVGSRFLMLVPGQHP